MPLPEEPMSAFVSREFSLHAGDAHVNQRISKEARKRRWLPNLNKILIAKLWCQFALAATRACVFLHEMGRNHHLQRVVLLRAGLPQLICSCEDAHT